MTRAPVTPTPGSTSRPSLLVAAVLVALTFAAYGNALLNPFIIDDTEVVLNDHRVLEGRWGELATGPYWPPAYHDALYRPLVKLSFALNWAISEEVWSFRLPNLLLHAGAAFMLFLLTRDLTRSFPAALAAAVVFVVHPIHTEVLNTIVGRTDLGAAFFGLLALWLFVPRAGTGKATMLLACGAWACALLCKESAVTLIGAALLFDVAQVRGADAAWGGSHIWQRVMRCHLPMFLVLLGYLAARQAALDANLKDAAKISLVDNAIAHPNHGIAAGDSAFMARWATPLATFGLAVKLMVWPHPLAWDYSYATIETVKRLSDPRWLGGALVLLALLAAMAVSYRRRRFIFFALGFGLATYSLVSNVFVLIGTAFAERLLYLPSTGFCMLCGLLYDATAGRPWRGHPARETEIRLPGIRRRSALIALAVVGVAFAALTFLRNRDWSSRERLDIADLNTHPRSCRLLTQMGRSALDRREAKQALDYAARALAVYPNYAGAWQVTGMARYQMADADGALAALQRSFDLGGANHEGAVGAAAEILAGHGNYAQAIELLRKLLSVNPLAGSGHNNLAWYLLTAEPPGLRDPQAARVHAEKAVQLRPADPECLDTLVSVLVALGRPRDAARVLQEKLPAIPDGEPRRADLVQRLVELRSP